MKKLMWGVAAVALALFGLGGVLFGVRQGGAFDVALGVLLLLAAAYCTRRAVPRPRPGVSGQSGHSRSVWE